MPFNKAAGKNQNKKLSLLVVEDCESDKIMLLEIIKGIMPDLELSMVGVERLAEAFKAVQDKKFDIIFLDLNLLDIKGAASIAVLRAEAPETPIVVYSGMEDEKTARQALISGATHYIVKGKEDANTLRDIIQIALGN